MSELYELVARPGVLMAGRIAERAKLGSLDELSQLLRARQ
jgi:hypothetical protein